MSPTKSRQVDSDDAMVRHLEAALDAAEDDTARFHLRQALQHHLIARDGTGETGAEAEAES